MEEKLGMEEKNRSMEKKLRKKKFTKETKSRKKKKFRKETNCNVQYLKAFEDVGVRGERREERKKAFIKE
ncbi:unnamed protein product [Sphenostylis stenocarpa]|uniref:Uncharacterized protein n=1 Tax=Sphenostylis stenocarpa TaxID=92480 RepID=A0AA86VB84_9FABA|nr:unnamed protein product [Sphenostylis stenocarpa]